MLTKAHNSKRSDNNPRIVRNSRSRKQPRLGYHLDPRDRLERSEKMVASLADRLGKPVDEKIKRAVAAMRIVGLDTTASCGGHLRKGTPFPWIDVGYRLRSVRAKYTRHNVRQQKKVLRLLDNFYANRSTDAFSRIIVLPIGIYGAFQLAAQGSSIQRAVSGSIQRKRLDMFQREFEAFADFILTTLPVRSERQSRFQS